MVEEDMSLKRICQRDDMPCITSVMVWRAGGEKYMMDGVPFAEAYARAREDRGDAIGESVMDLSDSARRELKGDSTDNALVQAIRLAVDTRKWAAGKMSTKYWGDKPQPGALAGATLIIGGLEPKSDTK